MNSEIVFDCQHNVLGESSSTFWGMFIKIPKLISQVATLVYNALVSVYFVFTNIFWFVFDLFSCRA